MDGWMDGWMDEWMMRRKLMKAEADRCVWDPGDKGDTERNVIARLV